MKRKIAIIVVLFLVLLSLYFSVSYFYPIFHFLFVKDKATQEMRSKQYADMKKYLEEYDALVNTGDAWQASQNTAVLSSAPSKGTSVEPKSALPHFSASHEKIPEGLVTAIEQSALEHEATARKHGLPVPVYPYRNNLEKLKRYLKNQGFLLNDLYNSYASVLARYESGSTFQNAKKTNDIVSFSQRHDPSTFRTIIDSMFKGRTDTFAYLLVQLDSAHSLCEVDQVFQIAEKVILGANNEKINGVDRQAILYYVMRSAMFFGYSSTEGIEYLRENHPSRIGIGCFEILAQMEVAGDW